MTRAALDACGHAGYLALVLGTLALALGRPRLGWPLRVAGSVGWAVLGYLMGYSSILAWSLVFAAIDSCGAYRARGRKRGATPR